MKIKLVIAVFVTLIIAGTSIVGAFPGETRACDGCHTLSSSISVATNVTSIIVNPNQSFAVGINWSGGLTGMAGQTEVNWPTSFTNIGITRDNAMFSPTLRVPAPADAGANGTTSSVLTAPAAVGNYTVRVYTSSGTASAPDGTNFSDINVTVLAPPVVNGSISGMKFNDSNNNSMKDSGETGLSDWTINLTNSNGSLVATTQTNSGGNYTFNGLAAGNYTVAEVLKAGWNQTFPAAPITYNVTLTAGQNVTGKDFGNVMVVTPTPTVTATATATATATITPTATVTGTPVVTATRTPGPPTPVPEFPTVILPVAAVMGLMLLLLYRRRG